MAIGKTTITYEDNAMLVRVEVPNLELRGNWPPGVASVDVQFDVDAGMP